MRSITAALLLIVASGWAWSETSRCLTCHTAPGLARIGPGDAKRLLQIPVEALARSVHGKLQCTDCHLDVKDKPLPHPSRLEQVVCTRCHRPSSPVGAPAGPALQFPESVHGQALRRGVADAPRCADCHGDHDIFPPSNPDSRVSRQREVATCGRCHNDSKFIQRHHLPGGKVVEAYGESIHGRVVREQGMLAAAICTDCHGVHDIRMPTDPMSPVNRPHIPATCGKCHRTIFSQCQLGIHGQALRRGVKDAPACTDCHGEHRIIPPQEAASSVAPAHIAATCSACHENVGIQRSYGLPAARLSSYISSYHGVANKFGETTVANCASCHGAHQILPSSDPRSSINKRNLPRTCGKCHPGAGVNFAKGRIHLMPSPTQDRGVYWVRVFYTYFIALLVAAFVGYIALDLLARSRRRRALK